MVVDQGYGCDWDGVKEVLGEDLRHGWLGLRAGLWV